MYFFSLKTQSWVSRGRGEDLEGLGKNICNLFFQERVSLFDSSGCTGTCTVDHIGLKLTETLLSLPPKAYTTNPWRIYVNLKTVLNKVVVVIKNLKSKKVTPQRTEKSLTRF